MKRGFKRPALSDPNPNPNPNLVDSALRKRALEAPPFDAAADKAGSSRISLDEKRALAARQHVRALNNQFVSWVQLQLQNHPDELWEDGVKDYLSHASHILEKFKDVVEWLKAEDAKLEIATSEGLPSDHKKSITVSGNSRSSLKSVANNGSVREIGSSSLQGPGLSNSHGSSLSSASLTSSSSSFSQNIGLPSSQNSNHSSFSPEPASTVLQNLAFSSASGAGFFGFSQKEASSSFHSSGLSSSQTSGLFSFSQTPASVNLQSSGLSNSQNPGIFGFNKTPACSSLQSSALSSAQSSASFGFNQTVASLSSQSSGLSSLQSSATFGISSIPASSSSQSTGFFSSQSSGFFSNNQKPAFSSSQCSGLSTSQNSSIFSFNQTSAFAGTQTFAAANTGASGDPDEEDELEKPSSPSLQKSEEKGVIVVHEVKCKVYVKPDNPVDKAWKDMGVGQLFIKCKEGASKAAKESKPTIVVRNDVGKLLLNALIYPGIKMNIKKNTIATIFHTSDGGQNGAESGNSNVVARTYLLRLKSEDETTKLAAAIEDYAPST